MNVYIVGVEHYVQWTIDDGGQAEWRPEISEFVEFMKEQAEYFNIDLLAEEFNQEAIGQGEGRISVVEKIAIQVEISHLFCEPTTEERRVLGIISEDHDNREKEWLRRLKLSGLTRILFVCGNDHVRSFSSKLMAEGCKVLILSTQHL